MKAILNKLNKLHTFKNWEYGWGDKSFQQLIELFSSIKSKGFRIIRYEEIEVNTLVSDQVALNIYREELETELAKTESLYKSIIETNIYQIEKSFQYQNFLKQFNIQENDSEDEEINSNIFFEVLIFAIILFNRSYNFFSLFAIKL